MKCLILAAGYATRLYPLTENFPKPLLSVQGKTILDHLLDDIEKTGAVSEYVVISNHKFARHFEEWAKSKPYKITVVDDGTESNETRLGAVKDIQFALRQLSIYEDCLVIAGDNLLEFSLKHFISYAKSKKSSCVMRYFEPSKERLKKCGVLTVSKDDLITDMTEKPQDPQSHWCCPPFYFFTKEDIKVIDTAIESGCETDAPGSFIAWLCKKTSVYAMEMPGRRFDIGTLESYENVKKELANCEMSPNKNKLRRRPCGRVIAKKPPRQKLLDSRIDKNQTAKILRMERQSSGLAILPEMRTPIS